MTRTDERETRGLQATDTSVVTILGWFNSTVAEEVATITGRFFCSPDRRSCPSAVERLSADESKRTTEKRDNICFDLSGLEMFCKDAHKATLVAFFSNRIYNRKVWGRLGHSKSRVTKSTTRGTDVMLYKTKLVTRVSLFFFSLVFVIFFYSRQKQRDGSADAMCQL